MPLRIVFCGTPEFALPSLRRLIAVPEIQIEAVITRPDRPKGRCGPVTPPPVKTAALEAGLPVHQPEKIKADDARELIERIAPEAAVIIAYGQIIPQRLLEIPRLGWINLHASLLPKYRGAAPIQRAILNGELRTGVTTMKIDAGLDTGPILKQESFDILPDETAPELSRRLADLGAGLTADTLLELAAGKLTSTPQDPFRATLAPPLRKEEGLIDWRRRADQIYAQIRAFDPWPGAYTHFRGQLCHVWARPGETGAMNKPPGTIETTGDETRVACGDGTWLKLEFARIEGRKRVTAREFINGARLAPRETFDS